MRIAIVGAGVAGAYLANILPKEYKVDIYEMKEKEKWWTVCAWGTSEPFISELVRKAGFKFEDYVLHRGRSMVVKINDEELRIKLIGLVTYDKHKLTEDMLEGHNVFWGKQIKSREQLSDYDIVVDSTGFHRSLLPKIKDDISIPSVEYQVKSENLPYDDFVIKPYPGLTGYWWYFPLGNKTAHVGAGDYYGKYRGELENFIREYRCEVIRKIGRPVRVSPPSKCLPFYTNGVVGVGESIGTVYPLLGEGIIPSMQCASIFAENIEDMEAYTNAVLKHFSIYTNVYNFIRAKLFNKFNIVKMFPTLLSVFLYMKKSQTRYGLEVRLSDFFKIVTKL